MEKKKKITPEIYKYLKLMPSFKDKKTQAFTTIALTFLALSFFGFFAINPTLSTIAKLKKELADSQLVDEKLDKKIQALSILQNQYSLLQNDLPIIYQAVPQEPQVPLLMAQTQSLAKTSGMSLLRIEALQVELARKKITDKKTKAYVFAIQGSGTFNQIMDFSSAFINFERVTTLDVISITQPEGGTTLNVNMRAKAYYKPE